MSSQAIKDKHDESKKSPAVDPVVTVTGTVEETTTVPILADGNDGRHNEEKSEERDVEKAIEESQSSSPAALEIPDGGRTAWLTVFGAWCILFSTFGMTNAYGVYQDFYVRHFLTNETPSAIGWVGSVQLFFQFSMGAITGKLFDAGHFYTIMIPGSLLYVFCYFMLSLTKPGHYYQVFLTQGLGAGIGLGLLFLPAMGVISHHFKNRRGLAMGIAVSGSSIGGLVFPVMLNKLIEQKGFPWATRAAAFLCTGVMTIAILCMKTRLPPKSKTSQGTQPPLPSVKDLVMDSKYTIATIGSFFNMLGLFTPIFYLQLYAVTHGVDPKLAFYTISILNGASVIGRIVPNFLSDIWGAFNTFIACTLACAIIGACMLAATDTSGIIAICVLYGLFSGAYISLIGPLFASLANNLSEMGIRIGLALSFLSISGLIGTPIVGLVDYRAEMGQATRLLSCLCIVWRISYIIARSITAKQKNTWKV